MRRITLLLLLQLPTHAQVPNISYSSPQTYMIGNEIIPLTPTNTGGNVPAVNYGQVTTVAGSGIEGNINGMGNTASFHNPSGIAVDAGGTIYVADQYNHNIRKITPNGLVTTFAGTGINGNTNSTGTSASFQYPYGLAVDITGNIYVADTGNSKIRKITPEGVVSTFSGNGTIGSTNGDPDLASFNLPTDVIVSAVGTVYVADHDNNKIRKITAAGVVSTLAGNGAAGAVNGNSTAASFNGPFGVAVDENDNVYIAEPQNRKIRKITSAGDVTTVAGTGSYGATDGDATVASFANPTDIAVDRMGNLYVADGSNHKIRKITPSGMVSTFAGTGVQGATDGLLSNATFSFPSCITIDAEGSLFIGELGNDKIRKITTGGYTISPDLPAGLVFNSATGTISGTPTVATPATTYTVTAYNLSGSSATTIVLSTVALGILSFDKSKTIVYPNPATEWITLLLPDQDQTIFTKIIITDVTGKILIEQYTGNTQIQISQLNSGCYIIQAFSQNKKQQFKFVKQ